MSIVDILRSSDVAPALQALGKTYGVSAEQLNVIIDHIGPALADRMERNTLNRGGVADLAREVWDPAYGDVLADPSRATTQSAIEQGNGALETILGSKSTSRSIAAQAAYSSGVEQAIIQKLLPIIASMVMAALGKGLQGGLGDILKKLPDLAGAGGQPVGRQSLPVPPENDEVPRVPAERSAFPSRPAPSGGTFGGGDTLPMPGDRIPGINAPSTRGSTPGETPWNMPREQLPDVIRRRDATVDGQSISEIIRNQIGSALGFQSKGFLSWIVRLIIMRWGWGLLTRILGAVLARR